MNISLKAKGGALASSPPRPLLADSSSSLGLKHERIDGNDLPLSEVWSVTSLVPMQTSVEGEGIVPPSDPRSRSLSESPIALLRYADTPSDRKEGQLFAFILHFAIFALAALPAFARSFDPASRLSRSRPHGGGTATVPRSN